MMALRLGLMAADWASAAAVFLLASIARFGDGEWMDIWQRLGLDIRVVAALFGLAWVAALWFRGLYQLRTRWRVQSEAMDILRATILVAALIYAPRGVRAVADGASAPDLVHGGY